jgi:large subunit ribosomal protein L17
MRHGDKVNNLGRKSSHRKAMISNMACSLIRHKRINTTVAKAKALRVFVEPLLTKSKTDSTHSRRVVFSYLQDKDVVSELFRDIAPKIVDRNGGYTRIIKTGYRVGDNAEMCLIELVDFNELYSNEALKKTTRRSRRGGKKSGETSTDAVVEVEELKADDNQDSAVDTEINDDIVADAEVIDESTSEVNEVSSDDESAGTETDSTEDNTESEEDTNKES